MFEGYNRFWRESFVGRFPRFANLITQPLNQDSNWRFEIQNRSKSKFECDSLIERMDCGEMCEKVGAALHRGK